MELKKIDITSTVGEKLIDSASSFLGKIVSPAAEELGLLIKDKISSWRFKNQVKILNRAKEICERNNISPKSISLKILVPLLEDASLEEDEFLSTKWAILISNLADPEKNVENNIFPFVLSQISKAEYKALESEYFRIIDEIIPIKEELKIFESANDFSKMNKAKALRMKLNSAKTLQLKLNRYEIDNLNRCGLIRTIPIQYGYSRGVDVQFDKTSAIEINIDHVDDYYRFTELGDMFIKLCSEKLVLEAKTILNVY